jgi:hypothetical protein
MAEAKTVYRNGPTLNSQATPGNFRFEQQPRSGGVYTAV